MREAFALLDFFQQKYWYISDISISNFNQTLANELVSFEQPGLGDQYLTFMYSPCKTFIV